MVYLHTRIICLRYKLYYVHRAQYIRDIHNIYKRDGRVSVCVENWLRLCGVVRIRFVLWRARLAFVVFVVCSNSIHLLLLVIHFAHDVNV